MKKFIFSKVDDIEPATFRDEPKEEKNLLKRKSKGSQATKQLGGLGTLQVSPIGPRVQGWSLGKIWIFMIFICLEKQFQNYFSPKINTNNKLKNTCCELICPYNNYFIMVLTD